jgi:septum formation protein
MIMEPSRLPPLILASQSPARRQLLTNAGIPFAVEPSGFDEDQVQLTDPVALVKALAQHKAARVAARHTDPVLILGADSVLYLHGQIYGKPDSPQEAEDRWRQMRGQVGELFTGHALIDTSTGKQLIHYGLTRIFFAKPSDEEIRAYVATEEPLACAGCFAIDGLGSIFVERIEGCHGNVIGLSLPLLRHMMEELGYSITDYWQHQGSQRG